MTTINENAITNIDTYNSAMARSLIDKIFFMDKIGDEITAIVDYGCADGTLINFLAGLFPDIVFVGYDISIEMIEAAGEAGETHTGTWFKNTSGFLTPIVIAEIVESFKEAGYVVEMTKSDELRDFHAEYFIRVSWGLENEACDE